MASRRRRRERKQGRGRRADEVTIPVGSLTDIVTAMTSVVAAIGAVAAATIRVMDGMESQAGTGNDGDGEHEGGHNVPNTWVPAGYPEQVNTGQTTGESSRRTEVARNSRQEPFTKKKEKITPRSQNFKKNHFVASHSQRGNNDRRNDNRSDPNPEGQTSAQPGDLRCSSCKRYHPNRPCRAGLGVCYKCGRPGHMSWNCSYRGSRDATEPDFQTRGNYEPTVEFFNFLAYH
ncbi:hypothetical protein Ahy_A07g036312 isoform B [Arachis hypogaea]|uniref:CCHC-type domain-containing protein n=3 Tax=Arachis hypogaea TaxID=3818 RepID=A0A445CFU2_ARAHY|nr:hypothetical protein Ahy_B10g102552 isoform B [Arachis hypogaea]RYR44476.1 hypothetical protein Ahy_A08g040805 isoform B [Arachis hypogaea]RYR49792.1 hypothetical protein Ahy_A07g036312 isoform B [Arachis hypogaea]